MTSTTDDAATSSSSDPATTTPFETDGAAGPSMLVLVDAPIFEREVGDACSAHFDDISLVASYP